MNLPADSKTLLRRNVSLSQFTTMHVGGPARYFSEPEKEDELIEMLGFAAKEKLPVFLMGKGSNVIFPDEGYPGLVITMIHYEQDLLLVNPEKAMMTASAGIHLYRLVVAAREAGLAGAEFLCNVPGTVGGGIIMNAGFSRHPGQRNEIGALIHSVTAANFSGERKVFNKEALKFSYRRSNLAGWIVLKADFQLWRRSPEQIQTEIRANFEYRNQRQDLRYPSSGSIFKNPEPPAPAAAALIEKAGLKGKKVGGAMISEKHSNYIVNTGQATSHDVVTLIYETQQAVEKATGVRLEPEVRIVQKP